MPISVLVQNALHGGNAQRMSAVEAEISGKRSSCFLFSALDLKFNILNVRLRPLTWPAPFRDWHVRHVGSAHSGDSVMVNVHVSGDLTVCFPVEKM